MQEEVSEFLGGPGRTGTCNQTVMSAARSAARSSSVNVTIADEDHCGSGRLPAITSSDGKGCLLPKEVSCSPERVKPVARIPGRMPASQSFAAGGTMKKFIAVSCLASIFCLAPVLGNAKEASPFCARQSESTGRASMPVCETATNRIGAPFKKFAGCGNWHACCCGLSWSSTNCQCE
jgi:hypothetical protein